MGYIEEFQTQINRRDFPKFLQLWEEYCTNDLVDIEELSQLLLMIKNSELAKRFGEIVESALSMWETISNKEDSYTIMKHLIDLQHTNSPLLYAIASSLLQHKYSKDPLYEERLRLVGMRTSDNFQGALASYDLLAHMAPGKFVFHSGGWGTGEIIDISFLREQVTIEFENVSGRKHLSLANAFKVLIPLRDDHFLARRFGDADSLEIEAKSNPLVIIKLLLQDLGPKTSAEIKDELCDLVIPEKEWAKWWQTVRARLKKDTMIEAPKSVRDQFRLRKTEVSHEDRFLKLFQTKTEPADIISTCYLFVRDFPSILKSDKIKKILHEKFLLLLSDRSEGSLTDSQALQVQIFLEDYLGHKFPEKTIEKLIQSDLNFEAIVDAIEIQALKKRVLILIRNSRTDWIEIFLKMLFTNKQNTLRDYLCKELNQDAPDALKLELQRLLKSPQKNPEMYVWYFQLILSKEGKDYPFGTQDGILKWFEGLLILLHVQEFKPDSRELCKKIYAMISGKRYALVRQMLDGSSLDFAHEFLLLTSKCQIFTESEQKILRSLAAVVHPTLAKEKMHNNNIHFDSQTIWTTEESFFSMQERVRHLGTTEMVLNAREIEAARALGDLRENAEYKSSLEKRSRLQMELKQLSEQLGHARIITKNDTQNEEVSIGSVVEIQTGDSPTLVYTILGAWDADADKNIVSLQSKLVQAMLGLKVDDKFKFRNEDYTVVSLKTIFDS